MKFVLIIDTAKLGESPVHAIVNLLQRQSEKLLRWPDATTWSDTLTDMQGKAVGTAQLVSCEQVPEVLCSAEYSEGVQPTSEAGLRTLVHGDLKGDSVTAKESARYRALRSDILTSDQLMLTAVAELLSKPRSETTPLMVDAAFDTAIERFK